MRNYFYLIFILIIILFFIITSGCSHSFVYVTGVPYLHSQDVSYVYNAIPHFSDSELLDLYYTLNIEISFLVFKCNALNPSTSDFYSSHLTNMQSQLTIRRELLIQVKLELDRRSLIP